MKPDDPYPVLRSAQLAVLLIFFMPSKLADRQQQALLTALADSLQAQLGSLLRILRIDEATHPDVAHSFAITRFPAFVLVRWGVELWRQERLSDETALVELIRDRLTEKVS